MLRRKGNFKFQGRQHSKRGIISMILGLLAIAGFVTISMISGLHKGQGDIMLGAIGLLCFAVSIFGFILSIKSFKEKDIFYVAPIFGVGSNGLLIIILFSLYIVGIVS